MIRITFLSENKTESEECSAEHGLSVLIQTPDNKILFDTGASDLFAKNGEALGENLTDVDFAVISHGHYDHTGGIKRFCEINPTAPVYIHKDAFAETYGLENGEIESKTCGIRMSSEDRAKIEERFIYTDGILKTDENTVITGTIPSTDVMTEKFYEKRPDGSFVPDEMLHEQALIIRDERGLFVFSGCSHRGVVPVLEYAGEIFPGERLFLLVAGMHLYSATEDVRRNVIEKVLKLDTKNIMPVHCTGIDAICDLKRFMGASCIVPTAGKSYEY